MCVSPIKTTKNQEWRLGSNDEQRTKEAIQLKEDLVHTVMLFFAEASKSQKIFSDPNMFVCWAASALEHMLLAGDKHNISFHILIMQG